MNKLWMDMRHAWRAMLRSPGVTLAIIVLLALGTGGVTAIFNPIYSTLFAPLPYPQPDRLVRVGGGRDIPLFDLHTSSFREKEQLDRIFSNLAAYLPPPERTRISTSDTERSREIYSLLVTEDFFTTLGVRPLKGSDFSRKEDRDGVIVSYRFWHAELNGSDAAIGKSILQGNTPVRVVGVMPENFNFPADIDIWSCGGFMFGDTQIVGRLRPGMSMAQAEKELKTIKFEPDVWNVYGAQGPVLQPLQTFLYGDKKPLLWMFGTVATLFLLLVCASAMNLLVTQGVRRKSEMAMRLILGATRRKLVFQLLRETLPLVIVGALAGLWLSEIAGAWLHAQFPALQWIDAAVAVKLTFFAALVLAVTLVGGLTPALYASGVNLNTYLKSGGGSPRRFFTLRESLVGVQLTLALALLICVGLVLRGMMASVDFPVGWSSQETAVVSVEFPAGIPVQSDGERTRQSMFWLDYRERLNELPEVAAAGILTPIPFSSDAVIRGQQQGGVSKIREERPAGGTVTILRDGKTFYNARPKGEEPEWRETAQQYPAIQGVASPEGFRVLNIPLVAGRFFTREDVTSVLAISLKVQQHLQTEKWHRPVMGGAAIINQSLAQQLWPGENAVGKTFYSSSRDALEVVGVVRDFQQLPENRTVTPTFWRPTPNMWTVAQFLVRLRPGASLKSFQAAAHERMSGVNSELGRIEIRSLREYVADTTAKHRIVFQMLGCFALLGIVVAGLGVYATTTLMAAARTRETGIRLAIGAQPGDILRLELRRSAKVILIGIPCGLFAGWLLSRLLSGFLIQFRANDPLVWTAGCVLLTGIAVVAGLIPALRAARTDPATALRRE